MSVLTFLGFLWNHGALGVSRVAQAAEVCYSDWGSLLWPQSSGQ